MYSSPDLTPQSSSLFPAMMLPGENLQHHFRKKAQV
jgi:hypothetical protein